MAYTLSKNLVPSSKYPIKCPYAMTPKFIVVHNTANDASAVNEIAYMVRNDLHTSFHYAVDDINVVQGVLESRNSWNAGDGTNGNGNRNGIAIEICYSKGGGDRFIKAEQNAVLLIVDILKRYGWGIEQVKKHQDFSGKYCPHRTLDMGWERFLSLVRNKMANYPFEQGSIVYPVQDIKLYNTAGYSDMSYIAIKKDTKCHVIKYHDKNGLYMALGSSPTVFFEKAWTKEFDKFTLTAPAPTPPPVIEPVDPCKELREALGASQGALKLSQERVEFLEDDKKTWDEEIKKLETEVSGAKDEAKEWKRQYTKVVTELNELKASHWTKKLRDEIVALWNKYKDAILKLIKGQ